jgi:hypothetical protein
MKLVRTGTAVLVLGIAACAANRSKEVTEAETKLTSAQMDARKEESRLNQKQVAEQVEAQKKPLSPGKRVELEAKQIEERATTKAEGTKSVADAQESAAKARASLDAERTKVEADAKARLSKADARLIEAKSKAGKLTGGKRAQFDSEVNTAEAKRTEIRDRLSNLTRASTSEWESAKTKLDKSLDDLDAALKRAEKDL